jgi:hypothetical protein
MYNLQDIPHYERSVLYHIIKISLNEQIVLMDKEATSERWNFIKLHYQVLEKLTDITSPLMVLQEELDFMVFIGRILVNTSSPVLEQNRRLVSMFVTKWTSRDWLQSQAKKAFSV